MTTATLETSLTLHGSRNLQVLLLCVGILVVLGTIMIGSASMDVAAQHYGDGFYYLHRQLIFVVLAMLMGIVTVHVPMAWWLRSGWLLLFVGFVVLLLVLTPLGRTVNGSTRWIPLGVFNVQVSEITKICLIAYLAGYVVRQRAALLSSWWGFLRPLVVLVMAGFLLMTQPDFGAATVLVTASMGMIFLSGVSILRFTPLILAFIGVGTLLVLFQPYRLKRVVSYLDPWKDQFDSGYQLAQSLIAFGRGEWFGVGLGNSIQKLFFLPEAHTDFIFSIFSEEFGLFGAVLLVFVYAVLVWVGMRIARAAEVQGMTFEACFAYGVTLLIGLQAFINMGVSSGLLPTKGLTLPLMSYGGSSLIANAVCIAVLVRVEMERRDRVAQAARGRT